MVHSVLPMLERKLIYISVASVLVVSGLAYWNLGGKEQVIQMTDRALRSMIPRLEQAATETLGAPVRVVNVIPRWEGWRPGLEAQGIEVAGPDPDGKPILEVGRAQIDLDVLGSLIAFRPRFGRAEVQFVKLSLTQTESGWSLSAPAKTDSQTPGLENWLTSGFRLKLSDTEIKLTHLGEAVPTGNIRLLEATYGLRFSFSGELKVEAAMNGIKLEDSRWFSGPLQLTHAGGTWVVSKDSLAFHSWKLQSEGLNVQADGSKKRWLFEAKNSDLRALLGLLPKPFVPDSVATWLNRAIAAGRTPSLELLVDDQAVEVSAKVQGLKLDYAERWPALHELQGTIHYKNGKIDFTADSAFADQMKLTKIKGGASALTSDSPQLKLGFQIDAKADSVLRFMTSGPIHESSAAWVEHVFPTAPLSAEIEAEFPIDAARLRKELKLGIELIDSGFQHPDQEVDVKAVHGRLALEGDQLKIEALSGKLGDRTISIRGNHQLSKSTELSIEGEVPHATLQSVLKKNGRPEWVEKFSGQIPFRSTYKAEWNESGLKSAQLTAVSTLQGMGISLPAPLEKSASQKQPVKLAAKWVPTGIDSWRVDTDAESTPEDRAKFFAEYKRAQPRAGIKGELVSDKFDAAAWSDLMSSGKSEKPASADISIRLKTAEFLYRDLTLHQWESTYDRDAKGWKAKLASQEAVGTIEKSDGASNLLRADFQKLTLAKIPAEKQPAAEATKSGWNLKEWPSLSVRCAQCEIGEWNWGSVKLDAKQAGEKMVLEQMTAQGPKLELVFEKGQTVYGPKNVTKTELAGRLKILKESSYRLNSGGRPINPTEGAPAPIVVVAERGLARFSLNWPGSPDEFSWAKAEGSFQGYSCEGRFENVRSFASALFNFLSLRFSDTRNQIMRYEMASFDFRLIDGKLVSQYIRTLFGNVFLKMEGKTDMVQKKLDFAGYISPGVKGLPDPPMSLTGASRCYEEPEDGDYEFEAEPRTLFSKSFEVKGNWDDPQIEHRWF